MTNPPAHLPTGRPIATETELKLAVRPGDLPAIAHALEIRSASAPAGAAEVALLNTYFDSPEHALVKRGLTLRVRQRDGRFIQTVKADADVAGLGLPRGEWEDDIAGAEPDLAARHSGRVIDDDFAGRLTPIFCTEVRRREIDLSVFADTHIEAALDQGRIEIVENRNSEPISEVELELKAGNPAVLYDIALDLLATAPLRLERRSKAERGYRLASAAPAPVKAAHAAPVELTETMTGDEALRRIGIACIDQILRNETPVVAGLPNGVHQMRVGVRRLRAVLSAFGRMLPDEPRRALSAEARWLADALGAARNLDVFDKSLLQPALAAFDDPREAEPLLIAVRQRREIAYAAAIAAVRSTRYTGLLLRLLRWFNGFAWRISTVSNELGRPIGVVAGDVLARRLRAVKRRSRNFGRQSPAERHRLRIALKKLRYTMEVLAPLYGAVEVERFLKRVKRLQDDLGAINDLRAGYDIVAGLGNADDGRLAELGRRAIDWHEENAAGSDRKLRKHLDQLLDARPPWVR